MPTSQVSGSDSVEGENEASEPVKAQQSSEGEAVEVQPEPVKDEVPSEGETEAVQH